MEAASLQPKGESMPVTLLRLGLIDEAQFTEVWCRHSNLPEKLINPYEIPPELLRLLPENQAAQMCAIPVGRENEHVMIAFSEPPQAEQLERLGTIFRAPLNAVLSRPSNITFSSNRAYPRLI